MSTPTSIIHRKALALVRDMRIRWSPHIGPLGGFVWADGSSIPASDLLVALYELRNAALIATNVPSSEVAVTEKGMSQLASPSEPAGEASWC